MTPEPATEGTARRARALLLVFAGFVVYGSFFPFSFHLDANEVERDLARFWGTLALFGGLQVVQRSHVPALTDVLTIGAGAALGCAALGRHRRWRTDEAVSIAGH